VTEIVADPDEEMMRLLDEQRELAMHFAHDPSLFTLPSLKSDTAPHVDHGQLERFANDLARSTATGQPIKPAGADRPETLEGLRDPIASKERGMAPAEDPLGVDVKEMMDEFVCSMSRHER